MTNEEAIYQLFVKADALEAEVDKHLQALGAILDKDVKLGGKLAYLKTTVELTNRRHNYLKAEAK